MKILVTGGNGLIGSHLAEKLLNQGHDLVLFDKEFNWHTQRIEAPKLVGDVATSPRLSKAARGADLIVHLAAVSRVEDAELDPLSCVRVNVEGTLRVIQEALKNEAKLLYSSSREVFGDSARLVSEESPKRPVSMYGSSKLMAENMIANFHRTKDLEYVITRFSNVYGSPRDRVERVIPKFVNQATHGRPITVYGGGQMLDFTFIDDVVECLSEIIVRLDKSIGEDYNIVSGVSTTIQELAGLVCKATKSRSRVLSLAARSYEVKHFVAKPGKISSLLGGSYRMRPLSEGLAVYLNRLKNDYR